MIGKVISGAASFAVQKHAEGEDLGYIETEGKPGPVMRLQAILKFAYVDEWRAPAIEVLA